MPEFVVQSLLTAALIGLGYLAVYLYNRARRSLQNTGDIAPALARAIGLASQAALAAFAGYLKDLDPKTEESQVTAIADQVYAGLPAVLVLTVDGREVDVPFKFLVSRELFELAVLTGYRGVEDVELVLRDRLLAILARWEQQGRPAGLG